MRQSKFTLRLNRVDFVVKHLLIRVKPEGQKQTRNWRETHNFYIEQGKLISELWWDPIEIC